MLEPYKNNIPEYAKDLKLNLSSVITDSTQSELSKKQILGIALASSYATRNSELIQVIIDYSKDVLDDAEINAAKAAASIMAMNNIYYRAIHLIQDPDYQKMPANLRMNVVGKPGIDKADFELFALAVSAINGCGLCMDSHAKTLTHHGVSKNSIQHAIRIASVINGLAQVSAIEK